MYLSNSLKNIIIELEQASQNILDFKTGFYYSYYNIKGGACVDNSASPVPIKSGKAHMILLADFIRSGYYNLGKKMGDYTDTAGTFGTAGVTYSVYNKAETFGVISIIVNKSHKLVALAYDFTGEE